MIGFKAKWQNAIKLTGMKSALRKPLQLELRHPVIITINQIEMIRGTLVCLV